MTVSDDIRRLLAEVAGERHRADAHDDKIRASAQNALARVEAKLGKMKHGEVAASPALAHQYRHLVEERERLLRVVS